MSCLDFRLEWFIFIIIINITFYFINFLCDCSRQRFKIVWRGDPRVSEAHCGYTSFHEYVITMKIMQKMFSNIALMQLHWVLFSSIHRFCDHHKMKENRPKFVDTQTSFQNFKYKKWMLSDVRNVCKVWMTSSYSNDF